VVFLNCIQKALVVSGWFLPLHPINKDYDSLIKFLMLYPSDR
jgi:hypothetical protein